MVGSRVVQQASPCADTRHNTTWCSATPNRRSLCNELSARAGVRGRAGQADGSRGVEEAAPLLRSAAWRREEVRFGARGSPGVQQWRYFSVFDCSGTNRSRAPPPRLRGATRGRSGVGAAEQAYGVCMLHKDKAHETAVMGLSSVDGPPSLVRRGWHGQSHDGVMA